MAGAMAGLAEEPHGLDGADREKAVKRLERKGRSLELLLRNDLVEHLKLVARGFPLVRGGGPALRVSRGCVNMND